LICNFCGAPLFIEKLPYAASLISSAYQPGKRFFEEQVEEKNITTFEMNLKTNNGWGCSICRNSEFSFYRLRSFGIYSKVLKKLIIKFKYNKIYLLAPVLCSFLKEAYLAYYREEKIDFIETVPDFTSGKTVSGNSLYNTENHMQLLARLFSKEVKLPYTDNIIKIRKTLRQQNLGMYERKVNLEGAFKAGTLFNVLHKNILLLDDVWTTGNTLNEISKTLKRCGADKIYLLTIARAI